MQGSISLLVNNLSFNDATLTLLTPGNRSRLGVVSGKGTQHFTVPWPGAQELRIQVSLLAGGSFTTSPVTVGPGERLELVIQESGRGTVIRR